MCTCPGDTGADAGSDRTIRLSDGRRLTWREFGDAGGHPVIALHGTPGSREKFAIASRRARELGLRLICPDRWGYGASDAPRRMAGLAAYARDCGELVAHLEAQRFSVVGVSGGGPYAAALAAAMPARVAALALVAPVGPIRGDGVRSHLSLFHRLCFTGLPPVPGAIQLVFGVFRSVLAVSPTAAIALATARAGRGDRASVRTPAVRDRLARTFRLGLEPGSVGPVIDMRIFARPWDVTLEAIRAPSRLWIGSEDRNVPVSAALSLAAVIEGCGLTQIDGAGHFWVTTHYDEVMEWVAQASASNSTHAIGARKIQGADENAAKHKG